MIVKITNSVVYSLPMLILSWWLYRDEVEDTGKSVTNFGTDETKKERWFTFWLSFSAFSGIINLNNYNLIT